MQYLSPTLSAELSKLGVRSEHDNTGEPMMVYEAKSGIVWSKSYTKYGLADIFTKDSLVKIFGGESIYSRCGEYYKDLDSFNRHICEYNPMCRGSKALEHHMFEMIALYANGSLKDVEDYITNYLGKENTN